MSSEQASAKAYQDSGNYQIVDIPTGGDEKLDLMLISGNLREYYVKPYPISPLGLSDHFGVIWKPSKNHRVT